MNSPSPKHLLLFQSKQKNQHHHNHLGKLQTTQTNNIIPHRRKSEEEDIPKPHDKVRILDPVTKLWKPEIIVRKRSEPYSYDIDTPNGK